MAAPGAETPLMALGGHVGERPRARGSFPIVGEISSESVGGVPTSVLLPGAAPRGAAGTPKLGVDGKRALASPLA